MGEPEDVPEESAAGPEARAEAERARQAYEREHGHLPEGMLTGRAMEDVVEAMMEHAYNQEAMQVEQSLCLLLACLSSFRHLSA